MFRNLIREDKIINETIRRFLESVQLKESTLSQLIGDTPEGQNLVRWLHRHDRLSNTAEYGKVTTTTDRIQWMMFKTSPDNFIIIQGNGAAIAIKPDEAVFNALRAEYEKSGKPFNPARNQNIVYQLVGYTADGDRIDNQLIPYPDPTEFGLDKRDADRISQNPRLLEIEPRYRKYAEEISKTEALHNQKIGDNAPPTQLRSPRGGLPFRADPHGRPHTLFDRLRQVVGNRFTTYTVVSHMGDLPKRDVKGFVKGHMPHQIPKGDIQGAFDEPTIGRRSIGGIEREKISGRTPAVPNYQEEFNKFVKRVQPILSRFIDRANDHIISARKSAVAARDREELSRLTRISNDIDDFEIAVSTETKFNPLDVNDAVVKTFLSALQSVSGIEDLNSEEGIQYLADLNSRTGKLAEKVGPVLKAIYQKLVNGV